MSDNTPIPVSAPTGFTHEKVETNNFLMIILILLVVAIGGLVEIVPLFFQKSTTQPIAGVQPYPPLQLMGRDIYLREGCYNCHSQMIRPLRAETLRYGHYSVAGEFVYDHPFQWGSKRTGPDLHRVGGKYSDEWHRIHLNNPRDLVPESNMPAYVWLEKALVDESVVGTRMKALRMVGVPYTDEQIANAAAEVKGKTEMDALVAYLQNMGLASNKELQMDVTTLRIVATLLSFATFLGILAWAFARRNRASFDEAARLPFEQD